MKSRAKNGENSEKKRASYGEQVKADKALARQDTLFGVRACHRILISKLTNNF